MDGTAASNDKLRHLLDVSNSVRGALLDAALLNPTNDSVQRALNATPQIIVCGPQSAGKSSHLSRLSGIMFPTHKTRCTRVPALLDLRRGEEKPVEVWLRGQIKVKDGMDAAESKRVDEPFEIGTTTERIRAAQRQALIYAGFDPDDINAGFVDSMEIEIKSTNPTNPNVTLVDLPGFVAEKHGKKEKEEVEAMVRRYVDMDGSLVLWTVNADQDFDTSLGKHIVEPHRFKSILVITRIDEAFNKGLETGTTYLGKIIQDTSAPRVVVIGNQETHISDEVALKPYAALLSTVDGEVELGLPALRDLVETRIYKHLLKQLPVLSSVILAEIEILKTRALRVAKRAPYADAVEAERVVRLRFLDGNHKNVRLDFLPEEREKLGKAIKNLRIRVLKGGSTFLRLADSEELFDGSEVLIGDEDDNAMEKAVLVGTEKEEVLNYRLKDENEVGVRSALRKNVYSTAPTIESMAEDVKIVAKEHQGIRNLAHVDSQPIIEAYAMDWANRYGVVLRSVVEQMDAQANKWVDVWFDKADVPSVTLDLVEMLHKELKLALTKLRKDADAAVARIVSYNQPPLVFTTNEHYLSSIYQRLVGDSNAATDDSAAEELCCKVLAYWKVQVKVVIEVAAKELLGTYVTQLERNFDAIVKKFTNEDSVLHVKKESRQQEKERERLETALTKLEHAQRELEKVPL